MRLPVALRVIGLALLLGHGAPLAAQEAVTTWDVRFAQSIRRHGDGSVEVLRWGNGELSLTQSGDSMTGTWTTNVLGTVTWRVSGTLLGVDLRLEATERTPNDPADSLEGIAWEATVSEHTLEGRMAMSFRGASRPPIWSPFSGRRTTD